VNELIDAVEIVSKERLSVGHGPRRDGDPPELVADSSMHESTGLAPRTQPSVNHTIGVAMAFTGVLLDFTGEFPAV
jgi:UDP-glucose 4-epimerase